MNHNIVETDQIENKESGVLFMSGFSARKKIVKLLEKCLLFIWQITDGDKLIDDRWYMNIWNIWRSAVTIE